MREALTPVVLQIGEQVVVRDPGTDQPFHLNLHDRVGHWTLMAVVELSPGQPAAVFENLQANEGPILYLDEQGCLLELAKSLEPTRVPEHECYRGHSKEEILSSNRDVLREEILGQRKDPDYKEVAACLPPIRRVKYAAFTTSEGPHTFVGSRECLDVVPIYYSTLYGSPRANPLVVAPEIRGAIEREEIWEGLIGGWLPVVRFVYPVREGVAWERIAFGVVDPPTKFIQPVWYRMLGLEEGRLVEAHYFDSYLPYPIQVEPDPAGFYVALYKLHQAWSDVLKDAMQLDLPERWISDFCRHAMVQEMITRVGDHPRYGILERNYGGPEHDGFQDILNSSVICFLEWGLFDIARGYLDNYFTDFVSLDGSIDYRGPELGQYGRMLANLAQFYEYTGDDELLLRHDQKVKAIVRILMDRREAAKKLPLDDPAYGMIAGRHEADISFFAHNLGTLDYERPYFCNSAEAWRGFRDLGRAWVTLGQQRGDAELVARGETLLAEVPSLQRDIYQSIERSILYDTDPPHLPTYAGLKTPFDLAPRPSPESFASTRVWTEMMHSGMVTRQTIDLIYGYLSTHAMTKLGIFGRQSSLLGFRSQGQGYGLIQHDMIAEFLLFYYAHSAHLHTRGTWTGFEGVDVDRDRAEHAPYCTPTQVTIPAVTKWMLVFEDPLSSTLWLAKTTPRAWLEPGERIGVKGAPTRWGKVSYEVLSRLDEKRVRATISLPWDRAVETKVMLRLRVPEGHTMESVELNGEVWTDFDSREEIVTLAQNAVGRQVVEVRYR